ncbi:hypothetical protein F2Q70_00035682 [Brassica cretica]|uniref:Uncharacterized protein n=1 Tax=Brassica cretica TaxID=69181 RepID=A0A8S9JN53_BRACR|nr:hypothetical protein F2Q70_00035682 [Brassica cretica]
MEDRLQTYEDMHDRFTSPIMRYLDTLSTQMMNVQRDIGTLNDQHDFQEECSTSIDRFRRASLDVKKPTEHLPYTAAEVDQITSKLYTAIDTMEDRFEKRCDDIYFPFDVRLSGLDSHAEWLQKEVKAIQRQFASQHQISASIDRERSKSIDSKAPASTDKHLVASIDTTSTPDAEQLIQNKMESMHEKLNELSAYAYDKIGWHQSLKEVSSELTIRGRYEEEAIVRRTSSAIDRYRREASTIEDYDRSMYIMYHRSMSRREMRDLVPADFKPNASPNYKITPDEERSKSIDSKAPTSTDKHLVASIDTTSTPDAEQLIQNKMESIHEELNELSAYAYDKIGWHQFSIENTQERLQNISNAIHKMDERWTINDEATRSFIAAWSRIVQIVLKMLKWINMSTIHICLDRLKEPKLTSNTKPDIIACLGA